MKKIVYIYEDGFASNNGSNHLHASIIKRMLDEGYTVHLLQGVKDKTKKEYPDVLKHDNFFCHSIEMPNTAKSSFVKRYLDGLSFTRKCKKVWKKIDFDMFFIQSSPTVSFNISKAKRAKKPIVYNIYDVFPGSAYHLGIVKFKILDKILKIIQRIGYKKANQIIVMSDDMKNVLVREKTNPNKIHVVNNWFDESVTFVENENNTFIKENNIDTSKFIVQYAGNIGQVFALEEFSQIVNQLKDNDDIEFHIIGEGVALPKLIDKTKDCKNIKFFGWQPQDRMSEIYSYCDMEIIPLHYGVIGNNVHSKVALALACGKPIINIVEKSNYYDLFEKNNIGYSFEHNEISNLCELLEKIGKDKNIALSKKEDCLKFTYSHYYKDSNLKQIINVIKQS